MINTTPKPTGLRADPPMQNKYLRRDRMEPIGELPDGTLLYPAYFPVRHGERFRRSCSSWDGATGETVGITLDGQLYRHPKMWGGQGTRPQRWERFKYWDG